jgi:DNA-binding PadR family transcriptional regulator
MNIRPGLRTPVALAVLNLLNERAMHPYEMQLLMRERGQDQVIKLKAGSLYNTIERLAAAGLIEPVETSREGRRPERTVYALTDAGRDELLLWLRDLVAKPVHEYPWFAAALAFLAALPPDDVLGLLEYRAMALEAEIAAQETMLQTMERSGIPRLFGIESEYALAMRRVELAWIRQIVEDMRAGKLVWPPEVLQFHEKKAQEADS